MLEHVGKRELKQRWSKYLKRVEAGEVIGVTDRGKLAFYLVPTDRMPINLVDENESQALQTRLEKAGLGRRSRRQIKHLPTTTILRSGSIADIVVKERNDRQ